jgi:hypothetical protein
LTEEAMAEIEKKIQRLPNLKKWFVETFCNSFVTLLDFG